MDEKFRGATHPKNVWHLWWVVSWPWLGKWMSKHVERIIIHIYTDIYIYIYGHPPPMIHLQAFYMGITSVLCTFFFTRKMTFSCFYFFYLLRKSPTQTHTHICNLFFWLFVVVLGKIHKNLEKTKKNKKNKIADPNSPACTDIGLAILFFLFFSFFLDFSR